MSALTKLKHCRGPCVYGQIILRCAMVCWRKHLIFVWRKQVVVCLNVIFSPWEDYAKAVKNKFPNKEMDKLYAGCVRFLKNQLIEIHKMMETGEVDSID